MMKQFADWLFDTPAGMQVILFAAVLFLCWNLENIAGLVTGYRKWQHASLNAKFILTNIPVQFLLGIAFAATIQWTGTHHFGVLYHPLFLHNKIISFITAFVLLDLGEYIYHRLMHRVKRLWMFHVVHHSDRIVDVSTTLREHPGENCIRNTFTLLWVFLSGVGFWALMLRQLIQIASNAFSHVNYRIPEKIDRWIGWIFITPNLHHVHHHYRQPYTDSNYGDVLSIWDRLFGTFARLHQEEVVFGVDTYMEEKDNAFYGSLMGIPFGRYRKNG
jgi:sterol desaturase/sphingolipid hydroxylase (fatty acid hydroxylase superfamily)